MEHKISSLTEVQKFFKALNEDIRLREDFYGKFKKLTPKDWIGFVHLGKEAGYNFTINELQEILGDEFYTGRRAAWKDTAQAVTNTRIQVSTVANIETDAMIGTWLMVEDDAKRKIVFTEDEATLYIEGERPETRNYKIGSELTLEYTFKFSNHEENTVFQEKIQKFEDDEMTVIDDQKVIKLKRLPSNTLVKTTHTNQQTDDAIKNSIIGYWVPVGATDEQIKYYYTDKTMTLSVDPQKVDAALNFNNTPINYKILAINRMLALTGKENTDYWKIKKISGNEMTFMAGDQEIKFQRSKS